MSAPASTTRCGSDALLADMRHEAEAGRRRAAGIGVLRRRHAVADAAGAGRARCSPRRERLWGFAPGIEITLEANPSSVEAANFAALAAAGVNRVSLGLQALDDAALRFLGRLHDVDEGLAALDIAQRHFARVSFDLIYARPARRRSLAGRARPARWRFGTGHLSLYQLTIEPGTRFATDGARRARSRRWTTIRRPTCSR